MSGKRKREGDMQDDKLEVDEAFLETLTPEDLEKEINIEFEFFNPRDQDRDTMIFFAKDYLGSGCHFDARSLALFAIKQYWVGTCIRVVDSEDIFGFITLVNLHTHTKEPFVDSLLQYFRGKCLQAQGGKESRAAEKMLQILSGDDGDAGLIVNERTESIPPLLAPHLHDHLHQEVVWAVEEEVEENHPRFEFHYAYYLLQVAVFYEQPVIGKRTKKAKKNPSRAPPAQVNEAGETLVYVRPEEEVYEQLADAIITYPVQKAEDGVPSAMDGRVVREERRLVAISASKIPQLRQELHKFFGTATSFEV